MHKLLFISNTQSYFNITIANQLKEAEYEILETTADTDEVNKIKDTISSLLIFVDEEMTGHQQELIFIKDKALENDTPIFLIGRRNEIDDARKFLPENLIQKEFVRPIDVGEIVKTVDDFVKKSQFTYYTADALQAVADSINYFANKEGLQAHGKSAIIRKEG